MLVPRHRFSLVGLGSAAFHGTLQSWGQACDELPMIYCATALFYSLLEPHPRLKFGIYLPAALIFYCALFTLSYFALPDLFIGFVCTYICLVLGLFVSSLRKASSVQHQGARGMAWLLFARGQSITHHALTSPRFFSSVLA